MTGSNRPAWGGVTIAVFVLSAGAGWLAGEEPALTMRASLLGIATAAPLTIELSRWSTDAERAPLLAALAAPPTAPPSVPAADAAGRGARGGRGGRGAAAAPSPAVRLMAAVKAQPPPGE